MKSFIVRVLIVLAFGVLIGVGLQAVLSSGRGMKFAFTLDVSVQSDSSENFRFGAAESGLCHINGKKASYGSFVRRLKGIDKPVSITVGGTGGQKWTASVDGQSVTIDNKPASMDELLEKVKTAAVPENFSPTKPVTVMDVLAADIPMPVRSRVSFPNFSFKDAFPGDTYAKMFPKDIGDNELIEIKSFSQAPVLSGDAPMPAKFKGFMPNPEDLPPVEERLPRNPAVVVGPDSPGNYSPGRIWHRVTTSVNDWWSKLSAESFVRFDPSGRIQPNIAYRWEIENGNRVYTFYLRKGHKWSDGSPFTAHDISFVCNTIIGSSYWPTSPNWMLETNGFSSLYWQDVTDWYALAQALTDTEHSTLAAHMSAFADEELISALKSIPVGGKPERIVGDSIINSINSIIREPQFFSSELFGDLDLESDLAELKATGYSRLSKDEQFRMYTLLERNDLRVRALAASMDPDADNYIGTVLTSGEISKLNQLMFRAALRGVVEPAKIEKVKVEALADDVIRFTFPRPNSIFLEKTATFMFYRGLFQMSEKFYRQYIPEGTYTLNDIDIYDWSKFTSVITGSKGEQTPLGRLYERMDEKTRQLCAKYIDSEEPGDELLKTRQEILDGVNAALASRDYYVAEAWKNVDIDKRWNELTSGGMSLVNSRVIRGQTKELLVIRDLLDRYIKNSQDPSDEEIVRMNTMLLREALGEAAGYEKEEILAVNREAALDRAAQHHPDRMATWIPRAQKVREDERTWENHVPSITAWYPISRGRDRDFWTVRNPYYYKVDQDGRQLPYIDGMMTSKETNKSNIQLSMSAGNVDFQVRELTFDNYTYLKSKEKAGNFELRLWANDYVGEVNFYFGQVHKDPVLRELFNDKRFRQAMSLALDRQEIIDICFMGLSEPAQFSVPEGSVYYNKNLSKAYAQYDPKRANAILDSLGLDKRNGEGIRLRPDGRPLKINLDAQEWLPLPVMQLASQHWRAVGVEVPLQIRRGALLSRMLQTGTLDIGAAKEGGNYVGPLQPGGMAPTHDAECPQWSEWVKFIRNYGRTGEAPPDWLMRVNRMWSDVVEATNEQQKVAAWQKLCEWAAEDVPRIGLATSPGKLVYVKNDFKNVPKIAMAGWVSHEPANCCPESFYFETGDEQESDE